MSSGLIVITGHRVHLRLVWICHCTQTLLFSGRVVSIYVNAVTNQLAFHRIYLGTASIALRCTGRCRHSFEFNPLWKSVAQNRTGPWLYYVQQTSSKYEPCREPFQTYFWVIASCVYLADGEQGALNPLKEFGDHRLDLCLAAWTIWDSKEDPELVHPCSTQTIIPWWLIANHLNHLS